MRKQSVKPSVVVPWSSLSVVAGPCMPSPASSASVSPRWPVGQAGPRTALDRVDWSDRPCTPHKTRRTQTPEEDLVLKIRGDLAHGDLGAIGADVIRQALLEQDVAKVPSVRTINRILARRGALDSPGGPADHLRPKAGICPMSPRSRPNWTASTLSRAWSSKTAPR